MLNSYVCLVGAFCQAPSPDEASAPVPMGSDIVASYAFPLGLSSASDGNQTGFKWDQISISY